MIIIQLRKAIILQLVLVIICGAATIVNSQVASGGGYTLNRSVIASGGGLSSDTTNNAYTVTGTIGEAIAGTTSTSAPFSVKGGFFSANPLAPTAASVTVSGRVTTSSGRGIRNVLITMVDSSGASRTVASGTFGYFRFSEVPAGETYIFTATGKRFIFAQPTQVFSINEDFDDIVFVGEPLNRLENR